MTANVNDAPPPPSGTSGVVQADAQTAGLAATTKTTTYSADTGVSSMEDLASKAPDLAKAMLMGIAQSMCRDIREAEERRKKNAKENSRYA